MYLFPIIQLLGGLAMFLYGIELMGNGLKNTSGATLKRVLERVTGNVFTGVLTGTLVTAVIQSSTATIVLAVALIGAGVLNLRQATSIVLGANIGTTVTAQITRLMDLDAGGNMLLQFCQPANLAPMALIIAIVLTMFVRNKGANTVGSIFMGFGILFTGILSMTSAVAPLSGSPFFLELLSRFAQAPILGILIGMVLTIIIQSSSAMVVMLQTLSSTGALTFSLVYPIIMGINLGTCVVTATICSIGSSNDAKRVGIVHILFNTIGTVLFMVVMSTMHHFNVFGMEFWTRTVDSGAIANFQTFFNLVTAIVLLPFTNQLVQLSQLIVKKQVHPFTPHKELLVLDEKLYISPAVAIHESAKAVAAMGTIARENFARGCKQLEHYDETQTAVIDEDEQCLDQFADSSNRFFIGLSQHIETQEDNHYLDLLLQTVPSFERIGDYATNLVELGQQVARGSDSFSTVAQKELALLVQAVDEIIGLTVDAFSANSDEMAKQVEPLEEVIDEMIVLLRDNHTKRLKSGQCGIGAGLAFIEALTYLERAADQCSTVALLMLARTNEAILKDHHSYLRELHLGADATYRNQLAERRVQYMNPLENLQ